MHPTGAFLVFITCYFFEKNLTEFKTFAYKESIFLPSSIDGFLIYLMMILKIFSELIVQQHSDKGLPEK